MQGKQLVRLALTIVLATVSCLAVSQPNVVNPAAPVVPNPAVIAPPVPVVSTPVATPSPSPSPAPNAQIWNLKNADIRAVIQTVSILTGKNFIVDPVVHGNVTLVSQKPMTPNELYQVFLSMLQLLNYAAIPSGNIIKIVPAMNANALSRKIATTGQPGVGDEIVVRVVAVNHVSATELVPVLRPLMSQSGSVTAYLPSNALILAGTASNIQRLVAVIHQMDTIDTNQITVVTLQYANAKNVVAIIHSLQSGAASQGNVNNATLAADDENNSILISANLANQLMMRNLIQQLDQKGSGEDDTIVVRLNYLSAKKLAPILTKVAQGMSVSQAKATGKGQAAAPSDDSSGGSISIQAEDNNNAVIMHAPKSMLSNLVKVIKRLDVRPQEVLVEAIIVKIDENLLNKLGIVWGSSTGAGVAAASVGGATGAAPVSAAIGEDNTFAMNANHSFGLLPDGNFISILHALKQNSASDVLATPSVVVLDNEKASIDDGQNLGMANRSYQGASAATTGNPAQNEVTPFNTIERQDVTLSLDVTPHISPNNMIRMALLQKDDSVASESDPANDNPTINTSKIKTSVLVKSGAILVLGGLMNNTQEKTVEKLPILGDLPVIGQLFRYNTHKIAKTSFMVFIRPVIMSKKNAQAQTMNRYSYIRHQEIDLETEAVKKQAAMPLLPTLRAEPDVHLPQPVPTFRLPTPNITTGQVH